MSTQTEAMKLALEALDVLLTEPIAHKAADRAEYLLLQAAPAIRKSLAEEPAQQEPEHIVHSNGRYSPLLTRMMNNRVESNVKQVIELYDSPEQPAQQQELKAAEAVGYSIGFGDGHQAGKDASPPAQRTWVGLTDEEQTQVAWSCGAMSADWLEFARAIEAKLKERNT